MNQRCFHRFKDLQLTTQCDFCDKTVSKVQQEGLEFVSKVIEEAKKYYTTERIVKLPKTN